MSVRRVDDDESGFSASSLDASISALADRLPGATRLSHVLAIGAKFKLEQQQQRKLVNTDAYSRFGMYRRDPVNKPYDWKYYSSMGKAQNEANCRFNPTPTFLQRLNDYRTAITNLTANPTDQNNRNLAIQATTLLAQSTQNVKQFDYLRQEDCYIVLNFIRNLTAGSPNGQRYKFSTFMITESLHHDRTVSSSTQPITPQTIANRVTTQLALSNTHLQQQDGRFAYNAANYQAFISPRMSQSIMDMTLCEDDTEAVVTQQHTEERARQAQKDAAAAEQRRLQAIQDQQAKRERYDWRYDRRGPY